MATNDEIENIEPARLAEAALVGDGPPTETAAAAALGALASRAQLLDEGRRRKAYCVGGDLFEVNRERPARDHRAESVDSLVALVDPAESSVWHSGDRVVAVLRDTDKGFRDDRVTWDLTPTEAWKAATKGVRAATQQEAIRLLADRLRKPVRESATADALLARLRSVKVQKVDDVEGTFDATAQAVGRKTAAAMQGGENFPDAVTLAVRRWAEVPFVQTLELLVRFDALGATFTIAPTEDEVAACELAFQNQLAEYLEESLENRGKSDVAVYAGRP